MKSLEEEARPLELVPDAGTPSTRPRLGLEYADLGTAPLDGVWWPRSRQLAVELPPLLEELRAHLITPALVCYHRDAWDHAPAQLALDSGRVDLRGFDSNGAAALLVIADDGTLVELVVIPPATDGAEAQRLLANGNRGTRVPWAAVPVHDSAGEKFEARALDALSTRLAGLHGQSDPRQLAQVRSWVAAAAEQFVGAPVQVFVPILVEHVVRGQLRARSHA